MWLGKNAKKSTEKMSNLYGLVRTQNFITARCRMDVADETVQPMGPQLVIHGPLTIGTFNEGAGIWRPTTSAIRRTPNTTNGSAAGRVVGQGTVIVEAVGNYTTDFEIAGENSKLHSARESIEMSRPPLDSTLVSATASGAKTPATDSSARK